MKKLLFILPFLVIACKKKEDKKANYFITANVATYDRMSGLEYELVQDSFYAKNKIDAKKMGLTSFIGRQIVYDNRGEPGVVKKIETFIIFDEKGKELDFMDLPKETIDSTISAIKKLTNEMYKK